jgi:hypothetical protein
MCVLLYYICVTADPSPPTCRVMFSPTESQGGAGNGGGGGHALGGGGGLGVYKVFDDAGFLDDDVLTGFEHNMHYA